MKTNNIVPTLKTLILALILAAGVSYISAWTGPTAAAPGGNVDAPVNVGLNHQEKLGNLFINTSLSNPYTIGLQVFGQSIFNGAVQINTGTPSTNKVLVSTDASGTVAWVATSTLGFGGSSTGVSSIVAGSNVTISPTTGVGSVTVNASNSGTVGGGCYLNYFAQGSGHGTIMSTSYTAWGNATGGVQNWGAASSSCTCPVNYTQYITGKTSGVVQGDLYPTGYICVRN